MPSSSRFGKDTKIGHFLKFFKGGTKGKSQKKEADFGGSKIACRVLADLAKTPKSAIF